ncbi:Nip100 p150 subunit of dynactin [Candida orthopsilosis Co 90-125]|uniref:Nip100 p150 subunit of dynactin n=1 Tax=Candida orthopsilosis (strain 90-125) TaxID=1136231 RepID=H8X4Z1_CANO9|nr:Nip100 p150 subunit of dynactin [Candida orthopsilosis Co 90-125]CCG23084.1 Nip100 p150 subunit of dynactin [Candida orthopsilosis Co 90-125]
MKFRIGDHVKVKEESGQIRYIGNTKFAPGTWFGVELSRPVGKNDGSVQGVPYFQCSKKNGLYGVFVKEDLLDVVEEDLKNASGALASGSLKNLQKQLKSVLSENSLCKKELQKLRGEMDAKLQAYDHLESKLEMQLIDNQYLQEANHLLEAKVAELTTKFQSLQKDYKLVLEELEVTRELENELRFVDAEAVSPNEIKLLIERGHIDEKIITELNGKVYDQGVKLSEMSEHLQASNKKIHDLSADLSSKNLTISHLKERLETFSDLEQLTEKLSVENGELLENIRELEKSIEELNQLHTLDAKIEASLQKNEQTLKLEIESLQDILSKDEERIKELEREVRSSSSTSNPIEPKTCTSDTCEHLVDLNAVRRKLIKAEQKYHQCVFELQICETRRIADAERGKFLASSPLSPDYINLVFDVKSQCETLDLLYKFPAQDRQFLFYKYAISRIRHFHQTILAILEYNHNHELSDVLFTQNRSYIDGVQTIIDEIVGALKDDSAEAGSSDLCHTCLKKGLESCHNYIAKLFHDIGESQYSFQNSLFIKHVEFSLSKFLSYLDDLASVGDKDYNLFEMVESVSSMKLKYDKAFDPVLSKPGLGYALVKSSAIPVDVLSFITEAFFQLINIKTLDSKKVDELIRVLRDPADLGVDINETILETNIKSIYEYVQEVPNAKEFEPDQVNKDISGATEVVLLKDKEISDLKLNISLLEQNMRIFTKQTTDQIQQLEKSLFGMKIEVEEKSAKIAILQEENKAFRNQTLFHKVNYDDIESQKDYDEKIRRMEKLVELKERATTPLKDQDLSWLAFPKRAKVWKKPTHLQSLSHDIRNLALYAQFIQISSANKQKWVPQRATPKYVNACIDEKFIRYKSKKNVYFKNVS